MAKRQAPKKGLEKKTFDLSKFKKDKGLTQSVAEKPLSWIPLSKGFHDAVKLPGFPIGYVSLVRGYSNTGKSTAFYEAIVGAQKLGMLPVIMETEGNFNWQHARNIGMEFQEVYGEVVDEETGEITEKIVDYEGDFIFASGDDLYEMYKTYDYKASKNTTKAQRGEPVIEDIARFMTELLDAQNEGELPRDLCFLWDSIGSLNGYQSATSKATNNQWNAGSMNVFSPIVTHRIPSSRRVGKPYNNTFICVQKIWLDNENKVIKHKGGEMMFFNSRLIVHLGGILSHGTKKLMATALGNDFQYGTETKIRCEKNHVNGIERKGVICSTPHGYVNPDELTEYKKEHRDFIHEHLNVDYDTVIEYTEEVGQLSADDKKGSEGR